MKPFALLGLLLGCAVAAETSADSPSSLLGCYTTKGKSMDYASTSPTLETTLSTLKIKPGIQDGQLQIESTMIAGNFHQCSISGAFEFDQRVGDVEFWRLVPDKEQLEQEAKDHLTACRLRLMVTRQWMGFMDPELNACHLYFACGTRVAPQDIVFKRSTRDQRKSNACESAS